MGEENTAYRVEQLEDDMKDVRTDVKTIMTNHLPHIEQELVRVSTTVKLIGGLILSGITALIIMGLTP